MTRRVLLVDYEPRTVRRLRGLLQQEGMETVLATNGNAAILACRLCRPDLVVVQDLIPGRHGFEVCKEVKNAGDGATPQVLLLFSPRPGRRSAARSCGCDVVLDKPFPDDAFLAAVRGFFPPEEGQVSAPDLEIERAVSGLFADPPPAPPPESPSPEPRKKARRRSPRRKKAAKTAARAGEAA